MLSSLSFLPLSEIEIFPSAESLVTNVYQHRADLCVRNPLCLYSADIRLVKIFMACYSFPDKMGNWLLINI